MNNTSQLTKQRHALAFQLLESRNLLTSVIEVGPSPNSMDARGNVEISASFDTEIDPASVTSDSFVVRGSQTGLVKQLPNVRGSRISISPENEFHPGELVEVTAAGSIANRQGIVLDVPFVWQFRVKTISGSAVFREEGRSLGNADSRDVELGDFDGDGDLDAIVADDMSGKLWLNSGNGEFRDSGQAFGQPFANQQAVAVGDLDGDGHLDAFFATYGGSKVWMNDGQGRFRDNGQNLGESWNTDVELGDLDGDGDLDAFVSSRRNPQGNEVWINDGQGSFSRSAQSFGGRYAQAVALSDLDGDGDLDAYVGNGRFEDESDIVWLNDGSGRFTESGQLFPESGIRDVTLGDVDGDGDLDALVAARERPARPSLWLNNGSGLFSASSQMFSVAAGEWPSGTGTAALHDVDFDGDLDAVVGNRFWLNEGLGQFVETEQAQDGNAVAFGDLDGDGDIDIFAAREGSDKVRLNNGENVFIEDGRTIGDGDAHFRDGSNPDPLGEIALGDLDGDGDLDAFLADVGACDDTGCGGDSNHIWMNDGEGRFHNTGQSLGRDKSNAVRFGDFDRDGDLDAIVANTGKCFCVVSSKIWLNDGRGIFHDSGQELNRSRNVVVGDIDGDGDLDAILSGEIWMNDGSGVFVQTESTLPRDTFSAAPVLGDMDNDGDLDVFIESTIWLNDGAGTFTDSRRQLGTEASQQVVFADLDGDGDLDGLVSEHEQPIKVWFNDGNGEFHDTGQFLGDARTGAMDLGDVDGDGDLDAIVVAGSDSTDRRERYVWLNDGSGTFTESENSRIDLEVSGSGRVTLGDLDSDGDLDAIIANRIDFSIRLNQDAIVGDANRDGIFDSADLVAVFQAGEFEDDVPNNSSYDEGDWNGDGEFDSSDLVLAFQKGHFSAAVVGQHNTACSVRSCFQIISSADSKRRVIKNEEQFELMHDLQLPTAFNGNN